MLGSSTVVTRTTAPCYRNLVADVPWRSVPQATAINAPGFPRCSDNAERSTAAPKLREINGVQQLARFGTADPRRRRPAHGRVSNPRCDPPSTTPRSAFVFTRDYRQRQAGGDDIDLLVRISAELATAMIDCGVAIGAAIPAPGELAAGSERKRNYASIHRLRWAPRPARRWQIGR